MLNIINNCHHQSQKTLSLHWQEKGCRLQLCTSLSVPLLPGMVSSCSNSLLLFHVKSKFIIVSHPAFPSHPLWVIHIGNFWAVFFSLVLPHSPHGYFRRCSVSDHPPLFPMTTATDLIHNLWMSYLACCKSHLADLLPLFFFFFLEQFYWDLIRIPYN